MQKTREIIDCCSLRGTLLHISHFYTFYSEACALITQRIYAVPEDVVLSLQDKYPEIASDDCSTSAFGKLQLSRMSRNFTTLFDVSFEIREMA